MTEIGPYIVGLTEFLKCAIQNLPTIFFIPKFRCCIVSSILVATTNFIQKPTIKIASRNAP